MGPLRLQPSLAGLWDQPFYAALEPPQGHDGPRQGRNENRQGAEPPVDVIQAKFQKVMVDAVWREQIHHGLELHPLCVGGRSDFDAGKACKYAGDQEPEHGEQEPHANTEGDGGALVAGV